MLKCDICGKSKKDTKVYKSAERIEGTIYFKHTYHQICGKCKEASND